MTRLRRFAVPVLALAVGLLAGALGVDWWQERSHESDRASEIRLVVSAGNDLQGVLDTAGGCAEVTVQIHNAGDRPVAVESLRVETIAGAETCEETERGDTIEPGRTVTMSAVTRFDCDSKQIAPTYSATVKADRSARVSGHVDIPPINRSYVCFEPAGAPSWFPFDSHVTVEGSGPNAFLPVTLDFQPAGKATTLTSVTLRSEVVFRLEGLGLPKQLGSLAPGAAPTSVQVQVRLEVVDCDRARDFSEADLLVAASVTPGPAVPDQELTTGESRAMAEAIVGLVDAACGTRG